MQIVIDIDDEIAQGIIKEKNDKPRNIVRSFQATIADAIKNGTPLTKGHGRLIDADALIYGYELADFVGDEYDCLNTACHVVNSAPTIIEADKAESEEV